MKMHPKLGRRIGGHLVQRGGGGGGGDVNDLVTQGAKAAAMVYAILFGNIPAATPKGLIHQY